MKDRALQNLFEPIAIGPMVVPNRIVMPAMDTGYAAEDNSVLSSSYDAARTCT